MKLLTLVVAIAAPAGLYANPTDPTVVSGSASFAASGATLTVTNSPSAIINWQSFSIGAPETTRFVQQNAASAVLNRVTGAESSQILGALQSNGQVFLINPAGVFFGAGARVDVAGLVASTLNLSNQDFLAGKLNFQAGPLAGSVINQGRIATPLGGSVILVGSSVENSGVINAPDGNVVLAAGSSVLIGDTGAPNVLVQVQATEEKAVNLGEVAVGRGEVGIYAGLVKQSGIVSADSAGVDAGGHIVFKAAKELLVDGDSVTSANGGRVELLGENVGVIDNAVVDASGASGGGTVLVGGDYRGANPSVANASAVFTGANSVIRADATQAGDGGKVVLWSEQATRAHGAISATGAGGGSGGFVETSSRGYLEVTQAPSLGAGGTWLLDPSDISVIAGTGTIDASGPPTFFSTIASSTLGNLVVNAALDAGTSVTITTSSTAGAQGNISVNAPITKSVSTGATPTLSLNADNNILVNSLISDTSGDGLNLALSSGVTTPTGAVTMFGGMDLGTGNFTANKDVTLYNPGYKLDGAFTVGGNLTLDSNASLTLPYGFFHNVGGNILLDPNSGGRLDLIGTGAFMPSIRATNVSFSDQATNGTGAGVVFVNFLTLQTGFSTGILALDTHTVTLQNGAQLSTPYMTMASGSINGVGGVSASTDFSAAGGSFAMSMSPAGTPSSSYQSSVYLVQASGTAPSVPITADSVSLTAPTINLAAVAANVSANSLSLTQQVGDITINSPLVYDSLSLTANSAGSAIALNSTVTADSVSLSSDVGASYTAATFVPRNGPRLTGFALSQNTGDIVLTLPIDADDVSLSTSGGSILHGPGNPVDVTANSLSMDAPGGSVGTALDPILTSVNRLSADTSSSSPGLGGIFVTNDVSSGALAIDNAWAGPNDVTITSNTDILLSQYCGDGCFPSIGSIGGTITIQSTGGSIRDDPAPPSINGAGGWVSANFYRPFSSAPESDAGSVMLVAAGDIDLPGGTVDASGAAPISVLTGGSTGGSISLNAGGLIKVGTITATGGSADVFSTAPVGYTGSGGTGGSIDLNAPAGVSAGTVDASGGAGGTVLTFTCTPSCGYVTTAYGTAAAGGNAGSIAITTGGDIGFGSWDGSTWIGMGVHADGGAGSSTATDGGPGGAGGTVLIQGTGPGMNVMSALPISASGGKGGKAAENATPSFLGNGGNGGAAGSVKIETVQGGLLAGAFGSSILAMGGNGGLGIVDGSGGAGGTVTLSSLDGTNGPGALDIGAARPDSLYGGLSINAAGGGGLVLGPNGVGKLDVGSGGITQLVSDPGANLASTVPLEIVADGHVFLDNLANVVPILFGSVNGNLSLSNSGSIGLGDPGQPLRFLDAAGNIIVRVPHGVSVPNEIAVHQPVTAGGDIIFTADDLIIDPVNGSVTTGAGSANFFELHSVDTAPLVVDGSSQSLLDAISTPLLRLGSQATPLGVDVEFGIPSANPPITFATIGGLSVFTTGNVFQNAGASLVFNSGAKGLQLTAGDISLSDPGNAFAVLAGRSGTDLSVPDPGSFIVANSGGFTVGTVDGVAGVGSLANSVGNSLTALAGTITVASGIQVNGDWTLSSTLGTVNSLGSTIDVAPAGVLTIDNGLANAGQINLRNAVGQTATLTVNTGALANQSSGVIDSSGTVAAANTINANGSGVALDNQGTIQAAKPLAVNTGSGSFDHNGGTITGPGNITASTFNWTRGTISGSGTFTVVDATLNNLDSAGYTLDGRPMTVSNTLNFAGVSWLDMVNGSTLTVNGLATLDTSAISSSFFGINSSAGAPSSATFNGGIVKLGAQPFDLALTVNTSGTVTASQGQLAIDIGFTGAAGGTHTNTSFVANSGAEISLSAGTHVATGNVSFGGAGTVHLWWGGSTRPFPTVFDASAATAVNTGNLAIDNSGKFIGNLANAGTLTLGDATLDGALDNTGTVVFASGAVSQTGIFTNASTGIVNFNGGSYASPAAFDNQGTVNVNAGGLILDTGDVVGGGIFNVGAAGGLEFAAGTYSVGSIANGGTLVFSGGTATLAGNLDTLSGGTTNLNGGGLVIQASSVFGNAGTVNINAGTLTLNAGDGGTSGGTYSIPAGSGLVLAAGSYGIGNVTGAGRFEVSGGTANVTNASLTGTTAPDGAFLSAGALNVSGAASIASLGHTGGVLGGAGGSLTVASYVLNNPSGTGTIGGTFADLSLTSPGDLTISGFNVTATGSLHLDSTAGKLWIDGATVTGGDVTLAGNWLVVDGTSAAAKVTASGTMTINAGTVDVTAGAFSASIDPPTLAIVATGDVTLTGGTGATAFAEIAGGSVTVSAPNVSLVGGAGADAYARIDASTGNLALTLPGSLSMTAGAGANADAVLTAPLGAIQVVTTTCAGCIALSADPLANTSSAETGGYAPVGGVTFSLPPSAPPVVDSGIVQATDVASSAGSGTSNVSNAPSGGEENGDDDADKRRKSKNVCRG